jgi:hypothetical protein
MKISTKQSLQFATFFVNPEKSVSQAYLCMHIYICLISGKLDKCKQETEGKVVGTYPSPSRG